MTRSLLVFIATVFTFSEVALASDAMSSRPQKSSANQTRAPWAGGGEGYYPINNLEQGMKNKNLARELKELAAPCLVKIGAVDAAQVDSCSIEIVDHCRTQAAANQNAKTGRGSANSCHLESRGCKAVDIGSISCAGVVYGPAESGNPSDYYLEFAKCINGDDFKKGGGGFAGGAAAAGARMPSNVGKPRGGVCYNHSCQSGGGNAVGNCPMQSHADHIHFSGDGCGHGEHSHPKSVSSGNGCGPKNGMKKGKS